MAVFLVNQCTFKTNEQLTSNGRNSGTAANGIQTNQNLSDNNSGSNLTANGVGLMSNQCGLKFDSLFELIHHIEENHISDYTTPATPYLCGPQQQPPQQQPHIYSQQPSYDTMSGTSANVVDNAAATIVQDPSGNISVPQSQPVVYSAANTTQIGTPIQAQQQQHQQGGQMIVNNSIYTNTIPANTNVQYSYVNGSHPIPVAQPVVPSCLPISCVLRIFADSQNKQQPPPIYQHQHMVQQQPHQTMQQHMAHVQVNQPQQIKYEQGVIISQQQDPQQQQAMNVVTPMNSMQQSQAQTQIGHPIQQMQMTPHQVGIPQTVIQSQPIMVVQQHQIQQSMTMDMMSQSQPVCTNATIDSSSPSSSMGMGSPKLVGSMNGSPYAMANTITTSPHQNVLGTTPGTIPNQVPLAISSNTINTATTPIQKTATPAASAAAAPKPVRTLKCHCGKSYKTPHGLRTHMTSRHSEDPQVAAKQVALQLELRDSDKDKQ